MGGGVHAIYILIYIIYFFKTDIATPLEKKEPERKSPTLNKKPIRNAKMKKSILDQNEFDTEREDYELKFQGMKEKIAHSEEIITILKNDKENQEFKIFKKKGKIKTLKEEINQLKSKLDAYVNKDLDEKAKEKLRKMKEKLFF